LASLELYLLGAPRVMLDGAPVTFDTRKAVALLAYLAVTGQPQQRDALAALLWPDADQSHARGALRRTLSVVHAALQRTPHLRIEREQVALDFEVPGLTCDVRSFVQLAGGCASHAGRPQPAQCADCLRRLEDAAAIYGDHFMAGFSLRDSAAYDDWQFFQGEELRRTLGHVLELLVRCHSTHHHWPAAITYARRLLALDTLHEPAHRQLMLLFAWSDQRAAALRQYQECQRILEEELGVPPLAETTQLYQAILNHQPPPPPKQVTPADPATPPETLPALLAPAASSPAAALPAEPLIGRGRQWQALEGAYSTIAAGGAGHLVVIEGEAGVGKTRLAQSFLAHLRRIGAGTAAAVCYSGEESLAFAPVEQLLRQALEQPALRERLRSVDAAWLRETQRLLPELHTLVQIGQQHPSLDAPGSQAHFLEGVMRTLARLLHGAQPGAILLDDVQAADGATLDLLAYLVRRLHMLPLLVIVTWSVVDVPPNHRLRQMAAEAARRQAATILTLPPFDAAAIAEMVDARRSAGALPPDAPAEQLAQRLYAETQGLPLFVAEYLDLLATGSLDPCAAEWPAPQGVRQFLHTRMAALSETAQQIVSTAAVIGRSFDLETVIAASGRSEDESIGALEELLSRRLILEQSGSSFDFAHAQLRSLVYEETSQVRRRLLHRRVADALSVNARRSGAESASMSAALANHYQMGGAVDKAARWAALAGEQARQVYANREAIAHFNTALALGTAAFGDAIPYVIHLHLGDLHTLQGEYAQALDHYQMAQKACLTPNADADSGYGKHSGKEGEIEHRLGRLQQRLGDRSQAMRHFARALELLPAEASTPRALVLADWSLAAYSARDLHEAVRLAQAALEQAQAASDQAVLARVYDILSLVERKQNNLSAALDHAERSLAAATRLNDPAAELAALNSLALTHAAAGAPNEAIPILHAALERCVRLGDRHQEAALRNNLADLYHETRQPEAAMEELKRAVAIFAEIGAEAGPENAEIWMLSEW